MAVSSGSRRGGHQVHHDQLTIIAAFVAGLIVAAIGVALRVRDGGLASSGVRGSGIAATQTRTVAPFSGLDLAVTRG